MRKISLIIPIVDNDEPSPEVIGAFDECIVVDGGTLNGAPERVRERGGTVLESVRGRAAQMNVGAGAATGDVLLFLHADTRLPHDAARAPARHSKSRTAATISLHPGSSPGCSTAYPGVRIRCCPLR